ncbi:MAG: nickel-dependent lactate racemase [Deltaproteobacteria bacterium]|jgi:nickel-dependent lactate racemase|nr:nickel-dependent lactate racemase [Deltaproteobacteria bacterium]
MPTVNFFYGRGTLPLEIPDSRLNGVLLSRAHAFKPEGTEAALVRRALENPIGAPRLSELARGKKNIVLLASDHTRPVPSKIIVPLMLEEIARGNPEARVTLLISTGCHRSTTQAELEAKFGRELCAAYPVVIHDCDASEVAPRGMLPSGSELLINKMALDADLLIAEGFIEPHFFAGFSGGRKSVFPGVTNRKSVMANHCSAFIDDPASRTGILDGNPIHRDMVHAAGAAKLAFIVNVVINSDKKVIHAVAGHYDQAHRAGAAFVSDLAGVKAVPADIVITTNGGYPLDQNLYQAVKGMTAAEAACNKGGVIIMAARCEDGHGGEVFYNTFKNEKNLPRMMEVFRARAAEETIPDQWQSQIFARLLLWSTVIMVTEAPKEMVEDLHMRKASSLEEALRMADAILGRPGSITAIPDGVGVIVLP